jgi:hypothetical protein
MGIRTAAAVTAVLVVVQPVTAADPAAQFLVKLFATAFIPR